MHKVLVVDDDPYILMSLEFLMKKNGFEVMVARNERETLDMVNNYKPDLVLLDIMMPDVDGYAICKHIKSSALLRTTKIVLISAKTKEADIQKGLRSGAEMYIMKPFSTRELVKKIRDLLT
jgi:DNA-binding response OmpR family regulator